MIKHTDKTTGVERLMLPSAKIDPLESKPLEHTSLGDTNPLDIIRNKISKYCISIIINPIRDYIYEDVNQVYIASVPYIGLTDNAELVELSKFNENDLISIPVKSMVFEVDAIFDLKSLFVKFDSKKVFDELSDIDIEFIKNSPDVKNNILKTVMKYMFKLNYIIDDKYNVQNTGRTDVSLIKPDEIVNLISNLNRIDKKLKNTIIEIMIHIDKRDRTEAIRVYIDTWKSLQDKNNVVIRKVLPYSGMSYNNNSCYQDSVLFALLAIPNQYIDNSILSSNVKDIVDNRKYLICSKDVNEDIQIRETIQQELINIALYMRQNRDVVKEQQRKDCTNLRKLFSKCKTTQPFHGTGTQDAGEFLMYIFNLFEANMITTIEHVYMTNDMDSVEPVEWVNTSVKEDKSPPILTVESQLILNNNNQPINTFLVQSEDTKLDGGYKYKDTVFYRRKYVKEIKQPYNYLVIYLLRQYIDLETGQQKKTRNVITPVLRINNLRLNAIVVHTNNHYTCYICYENVWYYYNDLVESIVLVGNFDDMLKVKTSPSVLTDGVLFFYVKQSREIHPTPPSSDSSSSSSDSSDSSSDVPMSQTKGSRMLPSFLKK